MKAIVIFMIGTLGISTAHADRLMCQLRTPKSRTIRCAAIADGHSTLSWNEGKAAIYAGYDAATGSSGAIRNSSQKTSAVGSNAGNWISLSLADANGTSLLFCSVVDEASGGAIICDQSAK